MNTTATLLMLSLALAACSGRGDPPPDPARPAPAVTAPCPGARLVGVLERIPDAGSSACELNGGLPKGWRGAALFERGSPGVAGLERAAPGELRRYCSYEWSGAGVATVAAMFAALDASPHVEAQSAGLECSVELPQGQLDSGVSAALHDAFRRDIGWLSGETLGRAQVGRTPIEVAVVDSVSQPVADDPMLDPRDPHGTSMAALIGDITCPAHRRECLASIHHTLALPRADAQTPPDWIEGGHLGTPTDVALAIYEAVERWRGRRQLAPRLVINLSVGWVRTAPDQGPDRALHAALEYAACQGAVVFAAAGNGGDPSCSKSQGPLTPASFEALEAPDAPACRKLGFADDADPSPIEGPARPLVYAVGGVDGHGRALTNARVGSCPRLVAAASQGLALDATGEYTQALSGSSVAAAVASGTAALVWSYYPQLRPDELVETLYDGGRDTGHTADFGLPGAPKRSRRIFVCAALERACAALERARGASLAGTCLPLDCAAVTTRDDEQRDHVRAAIADARAAHPGSVVVHRGSSHVVPGRRCSDESPGLAAALGRPVSAEPRSRARQSAAATPDTTAAR